jgi:uncharacterized membrane protein
MKTSIKVAAVAAGLGVLVQEVRRSRVRPLAAADGDDAGPRNRWRAVTINQPEDQVAPDGALPQPLAELGDAVEVRISPAADGKGTELAARLREPEPSGPGAAVKRLTGDDPRQDVRDALRRSKQLLETGEVLQMDPRPAGRRTATPGGKLLDAVSRRAGSEGVV